MAETVYAAMYQSCIWESAAAPLSLHKAKMGAHEAIEAHQAKLRDEHLECCRMDKDYARIVGGHGWDRDKRWFVQAMEVQA